MSQDTNKDPAAIERDIRQTQRDMSKTVDQIGDQFTPRNILNILLDKAEENGVDGRTVLDGTRKNPLALGLMAIGGIWLASEYDARPSAFKTSMFKSSDIGQSDHDTYEIDRYTEQHRGYVEYMSTVDRAVEEDDIAYRRRRNQARANYLMIEQSHDEDENTFHDRLDAATDTLRKSKDTAFENMDKARRFSRDQSQRTVSKGIQAYEQNPLIGGLIAAIVGAIAGSTVPLSQTEEKKLGNLGKQAIDKAENKFQTGVDMARSKKDEMVEKADTRMQQS